MWMFFLMNLGLQSRRVLCYGVMEWEMVDLLMLDLGLGLTLGLGLRFYFLSIQKYSYNPLKIPQMKIKSRASLPSFLHLVQLHQDEGYIVTCEVHLPPHFYRFLQQCFSSAIEVISVEVGSQKGHDFLTFEVLPDSIRGDDHQFVTALDIVLDEFWLCVCSGLYACLVAEGTGHCQSGHHHILHPDPSWAEFLTLFVGLREDSASKLEYPLFLIRPFWFLVNRKRQHRPRKLLQHLSSPQLMHISTILKPLPLELLLPPLLHQNRPRIANIKGQYPLIIHKNSNKRTPRQFRIDLALQQLSIGGTECHVDDLYQFFLFWRVVEFLQRTIQVFSLQFMALLIRVVFMKAETRWPFSPWPSHTQYSFKLCGSFSQTIAMSWFIFVWRPFSPALVRTAVWQILLLCLRGARRNFLLGLLVSNVKDFFWT